MQYSICKTRRRGCGWRQPGGLYMVAPTEWEPCGILPIELERCPTCGGGIKQTRSFQWINPQPLVTEPCEYDAQDFGPRCRKCYQLWGTKAGLLWIGASFYETSTDWVKEVREQGVSRRISAVPNDFEIGTHWVLVAHPKAIRVICQHCMGAGSVEMTGERDEVIGEHRCTKCNATGTADYKGGIFGAFKPTAIERVLTHEEIDLLNEAEYVTTLRRRAREEGNADDAHTLEEWIEGLDPKPRKLWDTLARLVKKGVKLVKDERVGEPLADLLNE